MLSAFSENVSQNVFHSFTEPVDVRVFIVFFSSYYPQCVDLFSCQSFSDSLKVNNINIVGCIKPITNDEDRFRRRTENASDDIPPVFPVNSQNRADIIRITLDYLLLENLPVSHLLFVDSDQVRNLTDIISFIQAAADFPDSVITGRRSVQKAYLSPAQRWKRAVSRFWIRLQTGLQMNDPESRIRCYPMDVLKNLKVGLKKYGYEEELFVRAIWSEVDVREIDVAVPYLSSVKNKSSIFSILIEKIRMIHLNSALAARSVAPVPHRKIVKKKGSETEEKISVFRPLYSLKMLLTANATPEQLALAGAVGIILGTLPLIAIHTVAILLAANYFRLNKVAAVSVSQLCTPPFVPALCIEVGYYLRHGRFLTEISMETLGYQAMQRLWEWVIGSLVLAPILGLAMAGIIYIASMLILASGKEKGV